MAGAGRVKILEKDSPLSRQEVDSHLCVMRRLRPLVVIDEQQRAYTDNALSTIDGFNPSFVLDLPATPRVARGAGQHGANILVDVRGADLERAEMIKLPINVDVRPWPDWKACLAESLRKLDELERDAGGLEADTARYLRLIPLVQVERTGADRTESGLIHANDAKAFLLQLGLREAMLDNQFEQDFACYLDGQQAVRWWHRNVACAGYGLQGWRRHRVYPDFVFVRAEHDGRDTLVVMATKGAHLANEDTEYKRRLLAELERAIRDERMHRAGELELVGGPGERLTCGLVFDENWNNRMNEVYFGGE